MSVIIVHGDKGGVGKSVTAAAYGEYVLSRNLPLLVIETDTRNADVARFFKGSRAEVDFVNLRDQDGWISLINRLDQDPAADVVISLPANIGGVVAEQVPAFLSSLDDMKRRLGVFWVMDRGLDSITLLKHAQADFSGAAEMVAIRNLHWGDASRFARWQESKTRKDFLAAGGSEINLPDLHDRATDSTFRAVPPVMFSIYAENGSLMGERHVLKTWVRDTYAAFESIAEKIGTGSR